MFKIGSGIILSSHIVTNFNWVKILDEFRCGNKPPFTIYIMVTLVFKLSNDKQNLPAIFSLFQKLSASVKTLTK